MFSLPGYGGNWCGLVAAGTLSLELPLIGCSFTGNRKHRLKLNGRKDQYVFLKGIYIYIYFKCFNVSEQQRHRVTDKCKLSR